MSSVLGPGGRPVQTGGDLPAHRRPLSVDARGGKATHADPDNTLVQPGAVLQPLAGRRLSAEQPGTQLDSLLSDAQPKVPVQIAGPGAPPASLGRIAAIAAGTPLPTREAMRADPLLGGREKSNLFLGLWARSTPYKQILTEVDAYHALTGPGAADAAGARGVEAHLEQIEEQLMRLRQSVDAYVQSDTSRLSRKPAMRTMLGNIDSELQRVRDLRAALAGGGGEAAQAHWPEGLSVERGLALLRAGLPLSDLQWAHDQSIPAEILSQSLQLGLPRDAIEVIAQYPARAIPAEVHAELTQGRPLEQIAAGLELGYRATQLNEFLPLGSADRLARFVTLRDQARDLVQAARAQGRVCTADTALEHITELYDLRVSDPLIKLTFALRLDPEDAVVLQRAAVPDDAITMGAQAGLKGPAIAFAHREGLDFSQVAQLLNLGLTHAEVLAALRPPADPALVAAWQLPQGSEPGLGWPLSVLLAKAGVPTDRLALREVRDLLALRASPEQIAAIAARNNSDTTLRPYLRLAGRPPVTRAEAMLLGSTGLTPEAAARYRRHAAKGSNGERLPMIPVRGPTVQRRLTPSDQSGAPAKLGNGAFNTVYSVPFRDPQSGRITERVFKPIQRPDSSHTPGASRALGIDRSLPRFELRNVVCSRIDRALGFGVIAETNIGVVTMPNGRPEIGVLMERVGGMTGRANVVKPIDVTDTELGRECKVAMQRPDGRQKIAQWCRRHGDAKIEIRDNRVWLVGGSVAPEVLPQDREYQRQLVSLQLVDALVGQGDRHDKNWMRVADATTGQTVRIVGIDNDQSLGRWPHDPELLRQGSDIDPVGALRGVGLPPVVDRSQFDAIMALTDRQLASLAGGLISKSEFEAMSERLLVIRAHLLDLHGKGAVIDPSQWGAGTLSLLAAPAPDEGNGSGPSSYLGRIYGKQARGELMELPPELVV